MFLIVRIDHKRRVLEYNLVFDEDLLDEFTLRGWIAAGFFPIGDILSEYKLNIVLTLMAFYRRQRQLTMGDIAKFFSFAYDMTEKSYESYS